MRPLIAALLILVATSTAQASGGIVVVMPFDTKASGADRSGTGMLDATMRTLAGRYLGDLGYTVLDEEGTIRILLENDIDEEKACDASCALEAAQEINATMFITGVMSRIEGHYVIDLKLMSRDGVQLASADASGRSIVALSESILERGPRLFANVQRIESRLTQERVRVHLESVPAGATVRVDNEEVCRSTPCSVEVRSGLRDVTFTAPGRQEWKKSVILTDGLNIAPVLALSEATLGDGRWEVTTQLLIDQRTERVWQRGSVEGYSQPQAAEHCERLALAGGGWRLPYAEELASLTSFRQEAASRFVLAEEPSSRFWSASPVPADPNLGLVVRLDEGSVLREPRRRERDKRVRCVRERPGARFSVSGPTVEDRRTSLVWERAAVAADAAGGRTCEREGTRHEGWRLPTPRELDSLALETFGGRPDPAAFPDAPLGAYRTSTGTRWSYAKAPEDQDVEVTTWTRCVRKDGFEFGLPQRTMAVRAGLGTHLGIAGIGVELALLELRSPGFGRRQVRLALGSGTHLVTGGLSFASPSGGVYVDLHAAWQRLGVIGRSLEEGFGAGVTMGYELRPAAMKSLGLKLGTGIGWSSANAGTVRPLLLDVSVGYYL